MTGAIEYQFLHAASECVLKGDYESALNYFQQATATIVVPASLGIVLVLRLAPQLGDERYLQRAQLLAEKIELKSTAEAEFAQLSMQNPVFSWLKGMFCLSHQNPSEAAALFKIGVDLNFAPSLCSYGWCKQRGAGISKGMKEGVKYYKLAAAQGYSVALNNLGIVYETGVGRRRSHWKAAQWYAQAACKGFPLGMRNYSRLLETGKGVPKNKDEAIALLERALSCGLDVSQDLSRLTGQNYLAVPVNSDSLVNEKDERGVLSLDDSMIVTEGAHDTSVVSNDSLTPSSENGGNNSPLGLTTTKSSSTFSFNSQTTTNNVNNNRFVTPNLAGGGGYNGKIALVAAREQAAWFHDDEDEEVEATTCEANMAVMAPMGSVVTTTAE